MLLLPARQAQKGLRFSLFLPTDSYMQMTAGPSQGWGPGGNQLEQEEEADGGAGTSLLEVPPKQQTAYLPSRKYDYRGGLEVWDLPVHACVRVCTHTRVRLTDINTHTAIHHPQRHQPLPCLAPSYYR